MDRSTHSAIEEFLSLGQPGGADGPLDVGPILDARGDVTPWQFLCGVAERHEVAFHGTGDPTIESPPGPENPSTSHRSVRKRRSLRRPTRSGRCSTRSWTAIATD